MFTDPELEAGDGLLEWFSSFCAGERIGEGGLAFLKSSDSLEGDTADFGELTEDAGLLLSVGLLITGASKHNS